MRRCGELFPRFGFGTSISISASLDLISASLDLISASLDHRWSSEVETRPSAAEAQPPTLS